MQESMLNFLYWVISQRNLDMTQEQCALDFIMAFELYSTWKDVGIFRKEWLEEHVPFKPCNNRLRIKSPNQWNDVHYCNLINQIHAVKSHYKFTTSTNMFNVLSNDAVTYMCAWTLHVVAKQDEWWDEKVISLDMKNEKLCNEIPSESV